MTSISFKDMNTIHSMQHRFINLRLEKDVIYARCNTESSGYCYYYIKDSIASSKHVCVNGDLNPNKDSEMQQGGGIVSVDLLRCFSPATGKQTPRY